jgi:hypothetical protein
MSDVARDGRHGPFTSRILDDDQLDAQLAAAGLVRERWIDERRAWLVAMPSRRDASVQSHLDV